MFRVLSQHLSIGRAQLALLTLALMLSVQSGRAERRELLVSDSIELTQIVDPPVSLAQFKAVDFNISPDGEMVAIVTRKGNLEKGVNEYALRLLTTDAALQAINSGRQAAQRIAVRIATASPKDAIERVMWLDDSRHLFFLGRDGNDASRIYEYDVASGELACLTSDAIDVATFDVSRTGDVIVFSAVESPDWTERNRRGYRIRHHTALDLGALEPPDALKHLKHYALQGRTGKKVSLQLPVSFVAREFSISPSGTWAVVLAQVHTVPYSWHQYDLIARYSSAEALGSTGLSDREYIEYDDALNRPAAWIQQYYLVNLQTGDAQVIIDSPSINSDIPGQVLWSEDEQSFILPSTYLPLSGVTDEEVRRRKSNQAIVEVDRQTLRAERILDLPEKSSSGKSLLLKRLEQQSNGTLRVERKEYLGDVTEILTYKKMTAGWKKVNVPAVHKPQSGRRVSYSIIQGLDRSPDIVATDPRTEKNAVITDFNPQLRELNLGPIELFRWTDRLGRQFTGGLVLPPGYRADRRYPIVLQTYGFESTEFLIDGPNATATAYAARPLASRGMLVLQMPELDRPAPHPPSKSETVGELELFQIGLEAALRTLDEKHVADMSKVGIIGFSREGLHTHYALTFSQFHFAAAIISDSITATPLSYVMVYGYSRPGMLEWEENGLIGAPLWGKGAALWFDRSPLFHLQKIRTPLRLETIGAYVPPLFETFAILKRHHRPVEMIHIPGDTHRLQTPWGRYTSQQGTVDWFSFWLLDEENPNSGNADQYNYWRVLRKQRDAAIADQRRKVSQRP